VAVLSGAGEDQAVKVDGGLETGPAPLHIPPPATSTLQTHRIEQERIVDE
jgi:hypothetical protein